MPNAASLQARLFGAAWLHYDVPRHRHHYSSALLARFLGQHGFRLRRSCRAVVEYDLMGALQGFLNRFTGTPNVLFDVLTAGAVSRYSARDIAVTLTLLVPGAMVAATLCALEWTIGRGGTVTITAQLTPRRTAP